MKIEQACQNRYVDPVYIHDKQFIQTVHIHHESYKTEMITNVEITCT